jgi:hypothetical protein
MDEEDQHSIRAKQRRIEELTEQLDINTKKTAFLESELYK